MRQIFVTILFLIQINPLFGQTIDDFYQPGATWTLIVYHDQHTGSGHSWDQGAEGIVYRIESDIMISGVNYHQLALGSKGSYNYHWDAYLNKTFSTRVSTSPPKIIGRIRVDNSKVYFTLTNSSDYPYSPFHSWTEYLLYDFSLPLGAHFPSVYGGSFDVTGIDSTFGTLSTSAPFFSYSSPGNERWLQGIGSTAGLIDYEQMDKGPWHGATDGRLLCYDNPAFSYHMVYTDSIAIGNLQNDCFNIQQLGVSNSSAAQKEVTVYPNPLSGNDLHVEGTAAKEISAIDVHDATGRLIYAFAKPFDNNSDGQLSLPLEPGIYLLRIEFSDGSHVTKLLTKI